MIIWDSGRCLIGFGANLATVVGADCGSSSCSGAVLLGGLLMVVIGVLGLFTGNHVLDIWPEWADHLGQTPL